MCYKLTFVLQLNEASLLTLIKRRFAQLWLNLHKIKCNLHNDAQNEPTPTPHLNLSFWEDLETRVSLLSSSYFLSFIPITLLSAVIAVVYS